MPSATKSFSDPSSRHDPEHPASCPIPTAAYFRASIPYRTEYRAVWPDGSVHWLRSVGGTYRDATGRPIRLDGVVYDITEVKTSEQRMRELQAELLHVTRLSTVGEMASTLAHEL